jgi:Domain of unknown function (DUF2828)
MEREQKKMLTFKYGENGALEYSDTGLGSDVLALSQVVRRTGATGLGNESATLMKQILANGTPQEVCDAIILIFVTRNTRGGKGEKMLAYQMFLQLWSEYPSTAKQLLPLFAHYGYWKDMLLLIKTSNATLGEGHAVSVAISQEAMEIMKDQLRKDINALKGHSSRMSGATNKASANGEAGTEGERLAISLLPKWLPRENSALDKPCGDFVARFSSLAFPKLAAEAKARVAARAVPSKLAAARKSGDAKYHLQWTSAAKAKYRRTLAELTSHLSLPEVALCAHREDEIDFFRVASKATAQLRKVFLNEPAKKGKAGPRSDDPKRVELAERFKVHVLKNGLKGQQLMPHEIVDKILKTHNISAGEEMVLDALWKDLWKGVTSQAKKAASSAGHDFAPTRLVPLADVSGSMCGTPMAVAVAMSIGVSEITHEAFRDMVITFESNPRIVKLNPNDTIVAKVRMLARAPCGGSTDFVKAYDLILKVASENRITREDMPSLIVFSDMQFNEAAGYGSTCTIFETIRGNVTVVGSRLGWADVTPTPMVFWNLRTTGGHPVQKDTEGTVLLSGFSPSLLKLVLSGDALREDEVEVIDADGNVSTEKIRVTPEEVLRKMLDDELYDPVRLVLHKSDERSLKFSAFLEISLLGDDFVMT